MKLASKISLVTLALSAGSAFAADLPSRKAEIVPVAPPPMWTGFYVGLNAGYGFGGSNNVSSTATAWDQYASTYYTTWPTVPNLSGTFGAVQAANTGNASMNLSGFAGGGQVGYNYQWSNSVVVGLEVDMQGTGIRGNANYTGIGADSYRMGRMNMPHGDRQVMGYGSVQGTLDWLGTLRGRVGYLAMPNLLVYATGGLTYGGASATANYTSVTNWKNTGMLNYNYSQTGFGNGNGSSTLVGWNAGGGLEWMFMPNWSLKGEAFYYDLGNLNLQGYTMTPASGLAAQMSTVIGEAQMIYPNTRVSYNGVIARAGVNYHFNLGSAPVVAKF